MFHLQLVIRPQPNGPSPLGSLTPPLSPPSLLPPPKPPLTPPPGLTHPASRNCNTHTDLWLIAAINRYYLQRAPTGISRFAFGQSYAPGLASYFLKNLVSHLERHRIKARKMTTRLVMPPMPNKDDIGLTYVGGGKDNVFFLRERAQVG